MNVHDTPSSHKKPASSALGFFIDKEPPRDDFMNDVIKGLSQPTKTLSPKYFYDEQGSALFDQICDLEEYYPTRTERALLTSIGPELATYVGPHCRVIEYGSGSSVKIRTLLDALTEPAEYIAIDISHDHLLGAAELIAKAYPDIVVGALCADFTDPAVLESNSSSSQNDINGLGRFLGFFPGSTIGNFEPDAAQEFLRNTRRQLGSQAQLLIGVDLKKNPAILTRAYNDAQGVTAAFNKNILTRIKNELGADISYDAFAHYASYNKEKGRVEMHLKSLRAQSVLLGTHEFTFEEGETLHTENSYKYSISEFTDMALSVGWRRKEVWTDAQDLFSIYLLEATS